jgi:hypothetical protein
VLFRNPAHPDRSLRLATCMNLWPAEDPAGVQAGLAKVSLPLRDALRDLVPGGKYGDGFGVGLWLPAAAAFALEADPFAASELRQFLVEEELDAFTFNAFPFGGFHKAGLKRDVFQPDWTSPDRGFYTRAVADFGLSIAEAQNWRSAAVPRHLSISTHTGGHRATVVGDATGDEADALLADFQTKCLGNLRAVAGGLGRLGRSARTPVKLGLEPEPRSLAGDTRELSELWGELGPSSGADEVLGVCLDTCHAAVEFEHPGAALERALGGADRSAGKAGRPLAKVQFSSALSLEKPSDNPDGVESLLGLDEAVYLHQTTGRDVGGELRFVGDLPELRALQSAGGEAWQQWLDCEEWRCHFHVPVDLDATSGLGTTRSFADDLLTRVTANPDAWGVSELHVEIETYTWSLPALHRGGPGQKTEDRTTATIRGIEAEYRHVVALLRELGWTPV